MSDEAELVIVSGDPLNAETPLHAQRGLLTPVERHYVRNHFAIPAPVEALAIGGAVTREVTLPVGEIRGMHSRTLTVTLECAGNGRAFLDPPAPGEPWRLGAVGTAEWTGVPLRVLLDRAGMTDAVTEILFAGADEGTPRDLGSRIAYERSLPLADAMSDDVIVAHAMNGQPLTPEHGAPLRLVVARWYGMASVKWLSRITALTEPFRGFYQADRYVIDGAPLREMAPRAVITSPREGETVRTPLRARGYCWAGAAPVARVDVSADNGETWGAATLGAPASPFAWREWHFRLDVAPGDLVLLARATDANGRVQPLGQQHNPLGYANNAAQPVRARVV